MQISRQMHEILKASYRTYKGMQIIYKQMKTIEYKKMMLGKPEGTTSEHYRKAHEKDCITCYPSKNVPEQCKECIRYSIKKTIK